ncbi:MAG: DNA recombination protein RmuC [bacterium]|nr:DNA recombination protein RmuC [bacterium]
MEINLLIFLGIGLLVGGGAAWFIAKLTFKQSGVQQSQEMELELKFESEKATALSNDLDRLNNELKSEREKFIELNATHSQLTANYQNLEEKLKDQKTEVDKLQQQFAVEFKNLANEIFEEKSKKFTDQNKVNIHELLKPLGEKISQFEQKVDQTNKDGIARNAALKEQIVGLRELNQKITVEAENLTKALKGDTKTQGNWGEFILESILEKSGLEKNREYFVQESITQDGRRFRPDVIVNLPDKKSIVIDSKVSLTAYERFVNEEDEQHLKHHLISIRKHVKDLGEKNYQNLYKVEGLDFILMFVPIEPAFTLAVQHEPGLFNEAYSKNIVIVSPTTLIATLRTIANIWKQEFQNRNALEIARQSGALYDKFKAFADDLIKIGNTLKQTTTTYESAMNKLTNGKGNLISRAERLKELGAKASKDMDERLLDRADVETNQQKDLFE